MKIHKLNYVLVVSIALISNFIIDAFAMSIEQLQLQYANSVLQTVQQRVAVLAWGSGSSVAVGEINRIISDSNKAVSEKKRKELLQIVDKMAVESAEEFKRAIKSTFSKFDEKDVLPNVKKLLTKLCNEVAVPYMQVFLEKLPIIVREYCAWHKPPVNYKNMPRDSDLVNLLEYAVEHQDNPIAQESVTRMLVPIITVGIVENVNNIFQCKYNPYPINFEPEDVYINLTEHKDEKHLVADPQYRSFQAPYFDVLFAKQTHLDLAQELTAQYKFHLMPQEGSEARVFIELARLIKNDRLLQRYIDKFKIKPWSYETLKNGNVPKIVIYVTQGKEAAQYVLNKLYERFKDYEGYGGYQPRYNQRVTNFLYFAQGDGNAKIDQFKDLFEDGVGAPSYTGSVYFKSDFTPEGANGGYHLTLPH